MKELFKKSSSWSCGKCKVVMAKINARLGELEKVDEIKEEVEEVKTELKTAAKERKENKKTASLEAKMAANTNYVKAATVHEAEQRLNKRKNIVLFGVPESAAATPSKRITHDKQELDKVLNVAMVSKDLREWEKSTPEIHVLCASS